MGGFVGYVYSSSILFSDCDVSKSNIIAGSYSVGGFVGEVYSLVGSVRDSIISGCKVNAEDKGAGSIIGWDSNKISVISNVSVLNTIIMKNKEQVANKIGNIDISSTVRGHVSKVPSRKPTTRKTATCKSVTRKPSTCKTCRTKRMVGKVKVNYKKML